MNESGSLKWGRVEIYIYSALMGTIIGFPFRNGHRGHGLPVREGRTVHRIDYRRCRVQGEPRQVQVMLETEKHLVSLSLFWMFVT